MSRLFVTVRPAAHVIALVCARSVCRWLDVVESATPVASLHLRGFPAARSGVRLLGSVPGAEFSTRSAMAFRRFAILLLDLFHHWLSLLLGSCLVALPSPQRATESGDQEKGARQ